MGQNYLLGFLKTNVVKISYLNPKSSESKYIYIIFRVFLETYLLFLDKQRSIGESQFIPKLAVQFLFFLIGCVIFFLLNWRAKILSNRQVNMDWEKELFPLMLVV